MKTLILQEDELNTAAALLIAGKLVAFPTETVYGLGADATNPAAVEAVYQAKGRPSDNPLIVHIADIKTISEYVTTIPAVAKKIMTDFWPGPLTMIFPVKPDTLAPVVTGGLSTAAFRMPDSELTLKLIKVANKPLVGPSANTSGLPSPTTCEHVMADLNGKIAAVLDGGATQVGVESTVIEFTKPNLITILRPGAVTKEQLSNYDCQVVYDDHLVSSLEKPKAPGMKYKHYAPKTKVVLIDEQQTTFDNAIEYYHQKNQRIGLLADNEHIIKFKHQVDATYSLGERNDIKEASRNLFAGLRALDLEYVDIIVAQTFKSKGLAIAYMNRLEKAANQQYFRDF